MLEDTSNSPAGNKPIVDSREPPVPETEQQDNVAEKEIGGREGPDPTRYGDWEKAGRCIDF